MVLTQNKLEPTRLLPKGRFKVLTYNFNKDARVCITIKVDIDFEASPRLPSGGEHVALKWHSQRLRASVGYAYPPVISLHPYCSELRTAYGDYIANAPIREFGR